jgi:hypothetical protein
MEELKVIARYRNGKLVKGTTSNFMHRNPAFHMRPVNGQPNQPPIQVQVRDLKAVFVVRSFGGNPGYQEKTSFQPGATPYGRKLQVTFEDGETISGASANYDPDGQGFFLTPADPASNNERIYVVNEAVRKVQLL